jgi:hypothetical protein
MRRAGELQAGLRSALYDGTSSNGSEFKIRQYTGHVVG